MNLKPKKLELGDSVSEWMPEIIYVQFRNTYVFPSKCKGRVVQQSSASLSLPAVMKKLAHGHVSLI